MPDTNELVLAAQGGDERAFTQLMLRHSGYVRNIALRYRIIEGEIDDVLQLVFEKVWQRLSDFRGDASFLTWLYRIAVNMCIDHIRKAKRKAECEYDDTVEQSRDTSAHVYSQNERLWAEEATVAIDSAVAGLTAAHAQILTLSLVEGLSHEEIAHHLGIPRGTVMSRLFHARHNTQRALLEKGIIPHSSTQEVGRREVDVASAKKSDRLDDLLRFRSPPERNADALGVALFLLRFVADLAKEAKDKWFHLDPRGKKYPNIARVESNSFHPVLIGLVRTGWLELSRDKKNKIVIARFVVPHSTLLEWHCYSPRVDDSDVPTDKKVQAAENRRRALEQMLKNDFSAWLTHTTQHQLVSEEKRIKYADLLSIALSGKSPPRKSSPEVRDNGIDSPKEGKVPATSGKGDDNMASAQDPSSKERAMLVAVYIQVGERWFSAGEVDLDVLGGMKYTSYTGQFSVAARKSGFMEMRGKAMSAQRRFVKTRFPQWMLDAVNDAGGVTETKDTVELQPPEDDGLDSITDQVGVTPPIVEEKAPETEAQAVAEEGAVAEVAQEAATPPVDEEVAGPFDALVESLRASMVEQVRTAEQRGYDRGYGVGYDKGHEDGYVDGKKVGEEEAGRRIRDAIQKALEAQDIED